MPRRKNAVDPVFVEDGDEEIESAVVNDEPQEPSGRRMRITIQSQEGEAGSHDVFISVNGYAYQIKRDVEVAVPEEVVEVLKNARQEVFWRNEKNNTIESREVPRHNFIVHGPA